MDGPRPSAERDNEPFFPSGAILFFALLIVLYGAIWFAVYWVMISRS